MNLESQFESLNTDIKGMIKQLSRIETQQEEFSRWVVKHEIEAANGFKRLGALEDSLQRVRGGMWVVGTLGIGSLIAWFKTKLGL